MGYDGTSNTLGYCKEGDMPSFKVRDEDSKEIIDLHGEFSPWSSNGIEFINVLSKEDSHPLTYALMTAYPNPFNPITNINFSVQNDSHVSLKIYDLQGRMVEELLNESIMSIGSYSVNWNASHQSSGVYVAQLQINDQLQTHKIILLK